MSFFFASAAIYCLAAYVLGKFTLAIGIVLLSVFVLYMVTTVLSYEENRGLGGNGTTGGA